MKKTITNITLAITAIVLMGFNQVNAQAQRRTNNGRNAFLSQLHVAMQPNYASNNNTNSLGKKATKQRLDSIVSEKYNTTTSSYGKGSKSLYTYDFNGRILSSVQNIWNDTFSKWQNEYKSVSAYNTQGYRTLSEDYNSWDRANNQWQYAYKNEYTFDNKGNQTSNIYYNWDVASQTFSISQKSKTNFILNSNEKPTISYDSSWNTNTNTYNLGSKTEYTYDANGNRTLELRYYFDGTTWNPNYKTEYTYNANNKVLVELNSNFNNGNWTQSSKNEYVYDANGNTTSRISNYSWNAQTNNWDNGSKDTYTFDANNNQTSRSYASWNSTTKLWENVDKTEFTYEGNGNLTNVSSLNWDKNTNQWVNGSKFQYNYNNSYAAADIVWDLGSLFFKHMVTGGTGQKWINNSWVNDGKFTAYYSANNFNSINESEISSTNVFPNPTSGTITIAANQSIETINVFDISGKLVHSQTNNSKQNNVEIDLSALNNGIYFIHAQTETGEVSKSKVVVSK
jgi:YD repeat-containing protein